mgnify:CR=1 FL=1
MACLVFVGRGRTQHLAVRNNHTCLCPNIMICVGNSFGKLGKLVKNFDHESVRAPFELLCLPSISSGHSGHRPCFCMAGMILIWNTLVSTDLCVLCAAVLRHCQTTVIGMDGRKRESRPDTQQELLR